MKSKIQSEWPDIMAKVVIALVLVICGCIAKADNEKDYVNRHCESKVTEYRLFDGTRVDCLLDDLAVEYDFGEKWHQSIGQALWYAMNTGRKSAVVIIVEKCTDLYGLNRIRKVIHHYGLPMELTSIYALPEGQECQR